MVNWLVIEQWKKEYVAGCVCVCVCVCVCECVCVCVMAGRQGVYICVRDRTNSHLKLDKRTVADIVLDHFTGTLQEESLVRR